MGFLRHVQRCNHYDLSGFLPFRVNGCRVGFIRPSFASYLEEWSELFSVTDKAVSLVMKGADSAQRSAAVASVLERLWERGVIPHLQGERYGVTARSGGDVLLWLDRAAASRFGIRAFGQHLNGYVVKDDRWYMWIGRRAADRMIYPGKLDHLVAGGVPYGISLEENLRKECWEEAAIPPELVATAVPVGTVTYVTELEHGLRPDTLYCYDLQLPPDFQPRCTDGEVECFYLWPVEKVMAVVRESEDFKPNCNLVIIDFLIRHGFIGPDNEEYLELVTGLHPALP